MIKSKLNDTLELLIKSASSHRTNATVQYEGKFDMKVLKVLKKAEVIIAELEVNFGDKTLSSPTLCVRYEGDIIPLNTPDGRPILMNPENAINIT